MGALVLRGSLSHGATAAGGVIHIAFINFITDKFEYETACRIDSAAITILITAIDRTSKPLVVTSGTLVLARQGLGC